MSEELYHLSAVVLGTIARGLAATVLANITGDSYEHRSTVSPWFRSIFYFQPEPAPMARSPW
ncbi:respiratory nitrate reductase subunit gamma [Nonomuraea rubra]